MPCIDTVQGFSFCPAVREPHTSVYSAICIIHAIIQTKRKNRLQGFTAAFPFICPIPAHTIQQPHKPPIRRLRSARGHTVKRCTSTNTRIPPPRLTLYRAGQPPIIIRYIRVRRCAPVVDPCQTVQHITDRASLAVCRYFPRLAAGALAWVSLALAWHYVFSWHGGTEPLTATAVSIFGLSPDS